jgi:ABC-type antimicrobial peptide transport system permease subunit
LADNYKSGLVLLLLAALSVLLLACANLASLLLARGLRNRQQTAVHVALGSPRRLLVRRALVESVVLAVIGGVAGVGVAWAGAKLILHLAFGGATQSIWIPIHAQPSLPVLLFALSLSLITGVAFGVAPAWITSHAEPTEAMRGAKQAPGGASIGRKVCW